MTRPLDIPQQLPPGMVRSGVGDCEVCEFPEVRVGAENADDVLPAGVEVLLPCSGCGVTALEVIEHSAYSEHETAKAFALYLGDAALHLFHWAPVARRAQIVRYGLRPKMRPTTHAHPEWRACFGDTPRWAWALSGAMSSAPAGEWDLWQTSLSRLTEPSISPATWANGIHEVRTIHRVYKRDLWHVGTRVKVEGSRG